NCILPDYRRQGFGRLQILEMLNRFKSMNFRKVKATTGSVSFFVPAQRMYLSCGFHEVRRASHKLIPNFELIYYEKKLYE
ncbi:MAG: GNAT family N-acetyltransferase, partial [candidate division WOR-3 bacterium]